MKNKQTGCTVKISRNGDVDFFDGDGKKMEYYQTGIIGILNEWAGEYGESSVWERGIDRIEFPGGLSFGKREP